MEINNFMLLLSPLLERAIWQTIQTVEAGYLAAEMHVFITKNGTAAKVCLFRQFEIYHNLSVLLPQ